MALFLAMRTAEAKEVKQMNEEEENEEDASWEESEAEGNDFYKVGFDQHAGCMPVYGSNGNGHNVSCLKPSCTARERPWIGALWALYKWWID